MIYGMRSHNWNDTITAASGFIILTLEPTVIIKRSTEYTHFAEFLILTPTVGAGKMRLGEIEWGEIEWEHPIKVSGPK